MKKKIYYILFFALSVLSVGCGKKAQEQELIIMENNEIKSEESNFDSKESTQSLVEEKSQSINKTFGENFSVNANIDAPEIKNANILYARYKRLDDQMLCSLFFGEKECTKQEKDSSLVYESDTEKLVIDDAYTMFRTNNYENIRFPIDSLHLNYEYNATGISMADVYKQEEVDFMGKEKAIQNAEEVISSCSINEFEVSEIYAIDAHTMNEQQEIRIQDAIDMQERMGITPIQDPTEGYMYIENIEEKNECYLMNFRIMQDKMPITQYSYSILDGERILNGSSVKIAIAENGVIAFESNGIYEIERIAESVDKLISAEEAVEKFYEISNQVYSTDKLTVEKISLEYVPVAYNESYDEVKLVPSWTMMVGYNHGISEKDGTEDCEKKAVCINAVTGEKIY